MKVANPHIYKIIVQFWTWLGSSQKLGLWIDEYNGSRSSCSPNCRMRKSVGATVGMVNSLHVCGRWIFWTLATMKCGSTLGIGFLAQSSSRSESFLLLLSTTMMVLEGLMLANIGFLGHLLLLLSTIMIGSWRFDASKHWFSWTSVTRSNGR